MALSMARPGLEPGTPRLSVERFQLSNDAGFLQTRRIEMRTRLVKSPQIPVFPRRFGRRDTPHLPIDRPSDPQHAAWTQQRAKRLATPRAATPRSLSRDADAAQEPHFELTLEHAVDRWREHEAVAAGSAKEEPVTGSLLARWQRLHQHAGRGAAAHRAMPEHVPSHQFAAAFQARVVRHADAGQYPDHRGLRPRRFDAGRAAGSRPASSAGSAWSRQGYLASGRRRRC
jgi:hypothetical protein